MDDEGGVIRYPKEATVFAAICAVVFCIFGIVGNFVTILALLRCPKLKAHATTAFVMSLCVSDLLFCSFNLPLTAARYITEQWIFGDALCQLFPVFFYGNVAVSLLNMVAITLNRYVLITMYDYYNKFYSKISICLQLLCTWLIAFLIMMPPLIGIWGRLGLDPSTFSCTILQKDGKSPKKFIFLLGFAFPCLVIIIAYSCIYWTVRTSKRRLRSHDTRINHRTSKRERDDRRLTRLMALIFICFLFCFLPLMLVNVFDDKVSYPALHVSSSILAWASSVINPFIYAATNKQYRSAYKKLFTVVRSSVVSGPESVHSNSLRSKQDKMQSVSYKHKGSSSAIV
ncbi:protein trapped in endoderm-1-like [Euwallacea fornicatus]|uniref:protein trapped in endoderm-1-like n=1 Tax=Euwallacea fornicatus TaxID=995702 RepID=UPI00338D725B